MISRVKGTQDFLDMTLFNVLIKSTKEHLAFHNFIEIQTPLLEHLDLFQRSLGEHTEVVSKEMFIIEPRQESSERICLRPEITASIARAFVENGIQNIPWKVFTYGPCFRYERPQKGRYRQFHQISIEVIGASSVSQDVQFIAMLNALFATMCIDDFVLAINFLGCSDDRVNFIHVLKKFLDAQSGICRQCLERKEHNVMRIFDCKNVDCQTIYKDAPHIVDHLCECCMQEWQQLQRQLSLLSVTYVYQPTLVRGLDYYNKTVFEFMSNALGAQNTFCGGGRYNKLVKEIGAKEDQPSIGAALGIERLMLLLEPLKETFVVEDEIDPLYVIIPMTNAQHDMALCIAQDMQKYGLCVDVLFEGSVKSMFRKANKLGAAFALIIGEDEQRDDCVVVKDMSAGSEQKIKKEEIVDFLLQQESCSI